MHYDHKVIAISEGIQGHEKANEGGAEVVVGMECLAGAHIEVMYDLIM